MASRTAAFETALLVVGFAFLFFLLPHELKGDDWIRLASIQQLHRDGHLNDGQFSMVMPLLSAPLSLIDDWIGSPFYLIARFNVIVVAIGSVVAFRLLRGKVEPSLLRKVLLVLCFTSLLTPGLRNYGAEISTATLVVVGMISVVTNRRPALGWGAMALGVANTPAAVPALVLVAGFEAIRARRLRLLLPVAAALLLIGLESWVRRGSPFTSGYYHGPVANDGLPYSGYAAFNHPFVLGLVAILFSFGRGLLFFAPGLALWLSSRTRRVVPGRRLVTMMLLFLTGLVLVYSKWWAWMGGFSWGPRFFFFAAVPASLFIAARIQRAGDSAAADALTLCVLVLSGWVAVVGATFSYAELNTYCTPIPQEPLCWYTPELSSLWQPMLAFPSLSTTTALFAAYCALVFCYLAAPLVAGILRGLARSRDSAAEWTRGWQF